MVTCSAGTLGCVNGSYNPDICGSTDSSDTESEDGNPIQITCANGNVVTCNAGTLGCVYGSINPDICGSDSDSSDSDIDGGQI